MNIPVLNYHEYPWIFQSSQHSSNQHHLNPTSTDPQSISEHPAAQNFLSRATVETRVIGGTGKSAKVFQIFQVSGCKQFNQSSMCLPFINPCLPHAVHGKTHKLIVGGYGIYRPLPPAGCQMPGVNFAHFNHMGGALLKGTLVFDSWSFLSTNSGSVER